MMKPESGYIPFEFEVVEIISDSLHLGGDQTIGQWIDETIKFHLTDGRRMGRLELDLTSLFDDAKGAREAFKD